VLKSIKLQSSSSSAPVRSRDSFLDNLLILFVKIFNSILPLRMCAACWVKQKERVTLRSSSYALRLLVARSEVVGNESI